FRRACRYITAVLLSPFARAVRTKSSKNTSSRLNLMNRERPAARYRDSVVAGRISDLIEPGRSLASATRPPGGSQRSTSENTMMARMPAQKLGIASQNGGGVTGDQVDHKKHHERREE